MAYALAGREATAGYDVPDPSDAPGTRDACLDPDALERLGDEIATLAANFHAAKHRLLGLIARFDAAGGWKPAGHRSCAHWLALRCGYDLGAAREHVRVARSLEDLPLTGAAMARGTLSFSQVRAITRVAKPESEADLLELAEGCATDHLERVVRAWKKGTRWEEARAERRRHESRRLSVFPDDDGMYVVHGKVDPEVGAVLQRAIEAAADAIYRDRREKEERERRAGDRYGRAAARRRADAIGLIAERALAAGFGGGDVGAGEDEGGEADETDDVPVSGTRAERYQVMLHVDADTLVEEGEPGQSELEDGTRVSAETSRRLACDASFVRIGRSPDGTVLDVGRRSRTIPPALRRALEVRDRGCRFPGCGLRFTDAHHVVHWADGGETSLANTILLCRFHHRLVHEEGWRVEWWGRKDDPRPAFHDPRGVTHVPGSRPPVRVNPDAVRVLLNGNRARGIVPDARTAGARWKRERDIPDEVLFRALDAAT